MLIHREGDAVACPCRSPEGFRDPSWHRANPTYPECNDAGFVVQPIENTIKAFVISAGSVGSRGMSTVTQLFGQVQTDDHIGIFPVVWKGITFRFDNWSQAGEEYVEYNGLRFIVVAWVLVPDPHDTSKPHHYEVGLRRINKDIFGPQFGF